VSQISNVGKIAYIYDQPTNTWHPVAGMTDASADFSWTGDHTFSSSSNVAISGPLLARSGINSFVSVADRNTRIPSPVNGTLAVVVVNNTPQLQYFYDGWKIYGDNAQLEGKSSSFTVSAADMGKTLEVSSASALTITVPSDTQATIPVGSQVAFIQAGTGSVTFVPSASGATVTLLSKNSNRRISTQYSQVLLVKRAANSWYLFGDLTAA
jgi:hypothetical protein